MNYSEAKWKAITKFLKQAIPGAGHRCWEWRGLKTRDGYGLIIVDRFQFLVHRLSFEHHKGKIPKGFEVMHDCDNPPCWKPGDLLLGTKSDNAQDAIRKGRR